MAGDHDLPGIGRKIGDEGIRIQISGKNLCGPGVCDEIDFDKMHILLPPKLPDEGGLSGLSGAQDTQRLFLGLLFPRQELVICFSRQHRATS